MARLWVLVALLLVLTVPADLWADEAAPATAPASAAALFAAMLKSQGQAYATARDELLCSGAAEALLRPKATDRDWRVAAIAQACLDRLARPGDYGGYERDLCGEVSLAFMAAAGPFAGVGRGFTSGRSTGVGPPRGGLNSPAAVPFLLEALLKGAGPPLARMSPTAEDKSPEAVKSREKSMQAHSRVAQCYAALALGSLNDPRAFGPLVELTRTGKFPELRGAAAAGLAWTGRAEAVGPIHEMLGDATPKVREAAAAALGDLLTTPDDPALVRLSRDDPDLRVRASAEGALAQIRARLKTLDEEGSKRW